MYNSSFTFIVSIFYKDSKCLITCSQPEEEVGSEWAEVDENSPLSSNQELLLLNFVLKLNGPRAILLLQHFPINLHCTIQLQIIIFLLQKGVLMN